MQKSFLQENFKASRVMSHIPDFGDAPTSPYGDAGSPVAHAAPTTSRCGHLALEIYNLL
jgi:hypothetical protein